MDPADIHPDDGFISRRLEFVQLRNRMLVATRPRVVEDANLDCLSLPLADMDQRAGRQPGLLRSLLDKLHSNLLVRRFREEVKLLASPCTFSSGSSLVTLSA